MSVTCFAMGAIPDSDQSFSQTVGARHRFTTSSGNIKPLFSNSGKGGGRGREGGRSHINKTGLLVGNFEKNP